MLILPCFPTNFKRMQMVERGASEFIRSQSLTILSFVAREWKVIIIFTANVTTTTPHHPRCLRSTSFSCHLELLSTPPTGGEDIIKTTQEDNSSESEEMKDKFCLFIFLLQTLCCAHNSPLVLVRVLSPV